jgi:hypothetical protein
VKTFALSCLIAIGILVILRVTGLVFFTGGGIIFPIIIAWVAASIFAFERRPRHLWLHVAGIGILIATLFNLYIMWLPRLYHPPPAVQGGVNMPQPMPAQPMPPR